MAERSIATVLKTVDPQGSVGSNPTLSANRINKLRYLFVSLACQAEARQGGQNGEKHHLLGLKIRLLSLLKTGLCNRYQRMTILVGNGKTGVPSVVGNGRCGYQADLTPLPATPRE